MNDLSEPMQVALLVALAEAGAEKMADTGVAKTLKLWRAAGAEDPWFGFGSYWTTSQKFAGQFRGWIKNPKIQDVLHITGQTERTGERSIYRATLAVPTREVLDIRPPVPIVFAPDVVESQIKRLVALGFRWVIFDEGVWMTTYVQSAIYLGTEAVLAVPA